MKKKMMTLGIVSMGIIGAFTLNAKETNSATKLEDAVCQHGRCIKIKSNGYQCKNCSQQYSSYCWSHKQ